MLDWPSLKALTNTIQEEEGEEEEAGEEKEKGKVTVLSVISPSRSLSLLFFLYLSLSFCLHASHSPSFKVLLFFFRPRGLSISTGDSRPPTSLPFLLPSLTPFLPQALEALLHGRPLLGRALTCDTTLASLVASLREKLFVKYGEKE